MPQPSHPISEPPHGFGDDAHSRFLRTRPPDDALAWASAVLGSPVKVLRACRGGSSSSIHALGVAGGPSVIMRRYVIERLNHEEPDIAEREARVLGVLDCCELPTPGLIAVDPTGERAGVPAVLMTRVSGRVDWKPKDLTSWLKALVEVLPVIHATPVSPKDEVQEFQPYQPESWHPPAWFRNKDLWERAVEVFHGPRLDLERVFIHRDYHPGNVLWRRQRISGVVDWQSASVGPPTADVWHCRANLIRRFGIDVADRFLDLWEQLSGMTYHPWTEAVMLVDAVTWPGSRPPSEREALEDLLARRLGELGR